jgi:hypothetical protein
MAEIYVAISRSLQAWAGDVGLTKHLYKLGVTDDAEAALARLTTACCAGRTDWKLVRKQQVEGVDEAAALARVGSKEMAIDPTYYPQLKGAEGIFKVKITNVENHVLVRQALAGEQPKHVRIKPIDFADYLIRNAGG